jgi:uncharacterized membrane protein
MVLELDVPAKGISNLAALREELPLVLVYLLSFVQIGIYWVNHHYLTDDLEQVTHGILWSNLALLFSLSLIPWATNWVAIRGISSFSVALYAVACALSAVAWIVLSTIICRITRQPLAGSPAKQIASAVLYLGAIPVAHLSPAAALGMIAIVAILWLLPPRKEHRRSHTLRVIPPPHSDPR